MFFKLKGQKAMAVDIPTLEERYVDSCRQHGAPPNTEVLSALFKAKVKRNNHEPCSMVVFLDRVKDIDFYPLLDLLMEIDASEIDAVDIFNESSCVLNGEYALSLMRAINQKLRIVDLQDLSLGKDFLRDLSQRGLTCQALNLRSSHFRKLNLIGKFMQMHTLNLDFSTSLTSFREDCFTCMPNLRCLSMCETRVSNLWTTIAALSKLPSLAELRFQNCLCCYDTGPCPVSSGGKANDRTYSVQPQRGPLIDTTSVDGWILGNQNSTAQEAFREFFLHNNVIMNPEFQNTTEDSSDDSEVDFSTHQQEFGLVELLSNAVDLQSEVPFCTSWTQSEEVSWKDAFSSQSIPFLQDIMLKYVSHHPSPICFEKHYREYMIASLPHLNVLDNLLIKEIERDFASAIFAQYFEYLPYRRNRKENVVDILQMREIKAIHNRIQTPKKKPSCPPGRSQYFYSRSLGAAKVGSSPWPLLHPLSILGNDSGGERSFRPRQFEYHPSNSSLMVFGTLDGDVVVVNHESEKIVSYIPSLGAMNSVLGLCWLKKYPSKLIAGSDNGSLKLYDIQHMSSTVADIYCSAGSATFDEFDQLTSVHVNSTDELFLASGYSKNVALYDINSGRRLQMFTDMHQEHINVVKFANHSPFLFVTSSFDQDVKMWDLRQKPMQPCYTASSSRGNVMACFSPDDHYLLVSAVDNEVKQLLAVDGRLHLNFEIASTGSSQNYTRSYYMNGRDYIISGSCDEQVVRICCTQTGRRLRDVSLEGKGSWTSMFVQSLRGDPFRDFNMSILAAYMRPSSKSEIVKVNLLASSDYAKEYSCNLQSHPSNSMGG